MTWHWDRPEMRAIYLATGERNSRKGKPNKRPLGLEEWEAERERNFARMYAKEVTKLMVEKQVIEDDPKVVKAFEKAMEVLEGPVNSRDKLSAARLILDFLKAKPVSKSEVTVQKAEDWLAQVTADALLQKKEED
jgi:uncharacterized protein YdgA (DUF945 family)